MDFKVGDWVYFRQSNLVKGLLRRHHDLPNPVDTTRGVVVAVRPHRNGEDQMLDIDWEDRLPDREGWPSFVILKV